MKLQILAACAALATLTAGQALAADAITAKLSAPVAEKTKFIAGGAMFHCEADACVALAPTSHLITAEVDGAFGREVAHASAPGTNAATPTGRIRRKVVRVVLKTARRGGS